MKILPSRFVFATVLTFVFTYQWYETFAQEIPQEEQKYARGFLGYVPLSIVRPGQIRISSANVDKKVKEAIEKRYIEKVDNKYLNRAFDSDKSIIPIDDPLPTILVKIGGKDWFLLLDGHHDTAAAFKTGSKTINAKVIDDLRHLGDDVWKYLLENKLIYARNMADETFIPLPDSFDALADDKMRYFATLIQRECQDHKTPTEKSKGPDYPVGVKYKDKKLNPIPFVEFAVGDVLRDNGLMYEYGEEKNQKKFEGLAEKAREILRKNPVPGFHLIAERTHFVAVNNGQICKYIYQERKKPENM